MKKNSAAETEERQSMSFRAVPKRQTMTKSEKIRAGMERVRMLGRKTVTAKARA